MVPVNPGQRESRGHVRSDSTYFLSDTLAEPNDVDVLLGVKLCQAHVQDFEIQSVRALILIELGVSTRVQYALQGLVCRRPFHC